MEIYLVIGGYDYEGYEILLITSDKCKAEIFMKEEIIKEQHSHYYEYGQYIFDYVKIIERVLGEPLSKKL